VGISPVEDEIRVMVGVGIGIGTGVRIRVRVGVGVRVEIVEGLELGAAEEAKFKVDLAVGAAGGAGKGELAEARGVVEVVEVFEREAEGGDEGFEGVRGFGVEDLEGEEGVVEWEREGEGEALVPDGGGVAGVVGFGGQTALGVHPENDVGLQIAVLPVDVLEVLRRHDGEVQIH